jgi:hypothetical protein
MDVGVNQPFKDGIRNSFDEFCILTDFDRKPLQEDVYQWVKTSFKGVKKQQIINTKVLEVPNSGPLAQTQIESR